MNSIDSSHVFKTFKVFYDKNEKGGHFMRRVGKLNDGTIRYGHVWDFPQKKYEKIKSSVRYPMPGRKHMYQLLLICNDKDKFVKYVDKSGENEIRCKVLKERMKRDTTKEGRLKVYSHQHWTKEVGKLHKIEWDDEYDGIKVTIKCNRDQKISTDRIMVCWGYYSSKIGYYVNQFRVDFENTKILTKIQK